MTDRLKKLYSFLESDPKDSFILFAIAKEYEKAKEYPKALQYYLAIRNEDQDYVGVYYHLGGIYEIMEDKESAKAAYKQGLEVAGKLKDFHAASELNNQLMNMDL
jgi:tetratricopeptide (TPR) repeat protein